MAEERNKPVQAGPGARPRCKLSASSQDLGEAEETLDVDYAGEEVAIGFNSRYLLDALRPIEHEQVVLRVQGRAEPRSGQKRRGRGVLLCYNAYANLERIFVRIKWES